MNLDVYIIRFSNNYGSSIEKAYIFTVICSLKSACANEGFLILRELEYFTKLK